MKSIASSQHQRGATVIEGALVLLTLFTLLFAIWEAGRLFNVQQVVTNAAREGARYAVAPDTGTSNLPSDSDIIDRVNQFLLSSSIEGATITINGGAGTGTPTVVDDIEFTRIEISVSYSFLSLPLLGNFSATLSGDSMMRNETSP